MVVITPWPTVSYVCRRMPSATDPRGMGLPTQPNDPQFYVDVPAIVRDVLSPTQLRIIVTSYSNFVVVADEFVPASPKWGTFKRLGPTLLSETFQLDPPNIAAGAQISPTFAFPGVQLGDVALPPSFDADTLGMQITACVSAPGQVRVVVRNGTAAAINLAPGTLRIDCWRH